MIRATFHTDDRTFEVTFDAEPWFRRASDQSILDLAGCGWGGDYPADEVGIHAAESVPEIADAFRYLEAVAGTCNACGFEVHVDPDDALRWLVGAGRGSIVKEGGDE